MPLSVKIGQAISTHRKPLELGGFLEQFKYFDVTPTIGREYSEVNLKEWLEASNSDNLIRDLAITVSQRGVVFFRKQDDMDIELQKILAQRLGELSGKPTSSKLHIHPISNSGRSMGGDDDEISIIASEQEIALNPDRYTGKKKQRLWHSDITFEPCPSDYAVLRLIQLPKTGGDTLWASGYELYDRVSKPYQRFLDGLTATYAQPGFTDSAKRNGFELYCKPRGSPENTGSDLMAEHPLIRTNPVTGWKSIFAIGHHVQHINGLTETESQHLLGWFAQLIIENHDLQVRHRWQYPNDIAIWDNRSVYHTATFDYDGLGLGPRCGVRAASVGERPYLDPESTGRREALGLPSKTYTFEAPKKLSGTESGP
ncbi:hypothetical protein MMC19_003009 [Ptychographa xylographoides]|nr:hypothetical protein [Ptychographa xylographoides]